MEGAFCALLSCFQLRLCSAQISKEATLSPRPKDYRMTEGRLDLFMPSEFKKPSLCLQIDPYSICRWGLSQCTSSVENTDLLGRMYLRGQTPAQRRGIGLALKHSCSVEVNLRAANVNPSQATGRTQCS